MATASIHGLEALKREVEQRRSLLAEKERAVVHLSGEIEKKKRKYDQEIHVMEAERQKLESEIRQIKQELQQMEREIAQIQAEVQRIGMGDRRKAA